jgi:hypothetical protein
LARIERLTAVVRWVLFALSLFAVPVAIVEPILFVPLATIWAALVLTTRLGDRIKGDWAAGLLPCLIALPIALQASSSNLAAAILWCMSALVLGLTLARGSGGGRSTTRLFALSVALPALAVVFAVWWNLRVDTSLAGLFDGDRTLVKELRDAVLD